MKGRCKICSEIKEGTRYKFPDTFTSFYLLSAGEIICNDCIKFLKDQSYRRKSWIMINNKIEFIDKKKALQYILEPPRERFVMYLTKTGKKQGFLRILGKWNYNRDRFIVAFDDSIVFVDREKAKKFLEIIKDARKKGFTKSELLGEIKLKHYEYEKLCEEILKNKDNPLWRLLVWMSD